MYFGMNKVAENDRIHSEIQIRTYDLHGSLNQILLRAGWLHSFGPSISIAGGYAFIYGQTAEEERASREHRLWEQLIQFDKFDHVWMEHRYRLEQRFMDNDAGSSYQTRARYRLQATFWLTDPGSRGFFVNTYDEIFIAFTERPFDQNRLYGAIGYAINDHTNVQVGYLMNTYQQQNLHRLQLWFIFSPDLRNW